MIVLRTFLTLAAGFATMAAILAMATLAARFIARRRGDAGGQSSAAREINTREINGTAMAWNLASTLVAALVGGYVTAATAALNPLIHALALALIVLLLGGMSAIQARGQSPIWFALLMVALAPCAVVLGGLLRLKQLGI